MAEERKPASKAQQKAQNRWIASAYDRINLTVEKGRKDIIKAFADAQGESVNGFHSPRNAGTLCKDQRAYKAHRRDTGGVCRPRHRGHHGA